MSDKPILFSGPMVRALLSGTKTQTRRGFKGIEDNGDRGFHVFGSGGGIFGVTEAEVPSYAVNCLRIAAGDRLYVRETWTHTGTGVWTVADTWHARDGEVIYQADGPIPGAKYWPSIHMPRRYSRLTLAVTDVRVERLQDISEEDAVAEGLLVDVDGDADSDGRPYSITSYRGNNDLPWGRDPVEAYLALWDAINGEGAADANPWVAAYSFTVERGNIDQLAGEA